MKKRLNCKDFDWYVEKFKGISPCDKGIFKIKFLGDKSCGKHYTVQTKELDPRFK